MALVDVYEKCFYPMLDLLDSRSKYKESPLIHELLMPILREVRLNTDFIGNCIRK